MTYSQFGHGGPLVTEEVRINPHEVKELHGLPRWTRRYGQSRTVPMMITLGLTLALFGAIAGTSYLAATATRQGDPVWIAISLALLVLLVFALVWLSVPGWGGKFIWRLGAQYYSTEGRVTVASPRAARRPWKIAMVGAVLFAGISGTIALGVLEILPIKYTQPVSALYVVPFLVLLVAWQWPASGIVMLLWPALYSLHAVLIVAGVPIVWTGKLQVLNMVIPVFGYGILTALVGHAYNRLSLRRLRRLSATSEEGIKEDR